jgi:hypothetical protein
MRHTLRQWLCLTGVVLVLSALVWWGIVFRSVVANDYLTLPQATQCLGRSSGICELAMSLCSTSVRHFLDISRYSPNLLWLGLALAFASLVLVSGTSDDKQ